MAKRSGSGRKESLITTAIRAEWQFSAVLSVLFFVVTFIFLPAFSDNNMIIRLLLPTVKPFLFLIGAAFALIAAVNYFRKSAFGSATSFRSGLSVVRDTTEVRGDNAVPVPEHQVVYGWSKDNAQWGNLGVYSHKSSPQRPSSWSIQLLQAIEWKLFEEICAAYYREKRIRAELTKLGADGGIDIKLFQDESGLATSLVQCKAWNSQLVGVKPIREFLGVMSHEKISKGFFMASGGFSSDAIEIARANGITLIDGKLFLSMILRLPAEAQQRLLNIATAGEYTTPSCSSCGIKMVRRTGKRGDFWGCANFPKCRQMLNVTLAQRQGI